MTLFDMDFQETVLERANEFSYQEEFFGAQFQDVEDQAAPVLVLDVPEVKALAAEEDFADLEALRQVNQEARKRSRFRFDGADYAQKVEVTPLGAVVVLRYLQVQTTASVVERAGLGEYLPKQSEFAAISAAANDTIRKFSGIRVNPKRTDFRDSKTQLEGRCIELTFKSENDQGFVKFQHGFILSYSRANGLSIQRYGHPDPAIEPYLHERIRHHRDYLNNAQLTALVWEFLTDNQGISLNGGHNLVFIPSAYVGELNKLLALSQGVTGSSVEALAEANRLTDKVARNYTEGPGLHLTHYRVYDDAETSRVIGEAAEAHICADIAERIAAVTESVKNGTLGTKTVNSARRTIEASLDRAAFYRRQLAAKAQEVEKQIKLFEAAVDQMGLLVERKETAQAEAIWKRFAQAGQGAAQDSVFDNLFGNSNTEAENTAMLSESDSPLSLGEMEASQEVESESEEEIIFSDDDLEPLVLLEEDLPALSEDGEGQEFAGIFY